MSLEPTFRASPQVVSGASAGSGDGVHHTVVASRLIVAGTAVLALAGLLGNGLWAPLAVALLVGLPHGAVDHVVLARRIGGRLGVGVGTVAYATLAVTVFLLAGALPLLTWTAFLLVSAWHFGTADRAALDVDGDRPSWVHAVAAGLIPVGGLLSLGAPTLRPLALELSPRLAVLLSPPVAATVAGLTIVVVATAVVVESTAGRGRHVLELALLTALFAIAPPLWAFAVYFGAWHAPRHVARMLDEESPYAALTARQEYVASVLRFGRDAAGPTTVAGIALLLLVLGANRLTPVTLTALVLQLTAAVTFPHVLAVAFLDHRTGRLGLFR